MPELSVKPPAEVAGSAPAHRRGASLAGARERERRAEALRRQRADTRAQTMASAGELGYLRAQLRVAANLTARLAATQEIEEMVRLVVEELHCTFAFYLAAIQRLDGDGMLRLVASAGPLAEVMTEFLLVEQPVARASTVASRARAAPRWCPTRERTADYIARDPQTDPRSELSAPIFVDGDVWGVLNIEAVEPGAFGEADAVLVETIAASLGAAVHRAGLIAGHGAHLHDDARGAHEHGRGEGRLHRLTRRGRREPRRAGRAAHGPDARTGARRALRGDAARRRQDRGAERDPAQARPADRARSGS